jgi:hypothetical protein
MVEGQANDLYTSDTDSWSATSTVQGSAEEPLVDSHSASGSRSHYELPRVVSKVISLRRVFDVAVLLVSA